MAGLAESTGIFQLFSDATRVRLTALVEERELTVAELTQVTQLGQSRVSTHLGRLREAGVVRDRRAGASTYYRLNEAMPDAAQRTWALLRAQLDDAVIASDRARAEEVVLARDEGAWPDAIAGRMERHYSPGRTWESLARGFVGLVRQGDVLDVGGGDGTVAQLLASRCASYTLVDRNEKMLEAAARRLEGTGVRVERGDMHELPFAGASFDHVLMLNVLQHSHAPDRALGEAARVLRGGAELTLVTLARHGHPEITESYGHVSPGFDPEPLAALLRGAGLAPSRCDVTSRERRAPHFRVVTAFATKAAP